MPKQRIIVSFDLDIEEPEDYLELHDAIEVLGSEALKEGRFDLRKVEPVEELFLVTIEMYGWKHSNYRDDALEWFDKLVPAIERRLKPMFAISPFHGKVKLIRSDQGDVISQKEING